MNPAERMIPILPRNSIDDQIGFYETALAGSLLENVAGVSLGPDDRVALEDELQRADDLRGTLA